MAYSYEGAFVVNAATTFALKKKERSHFYEFFLHVEAWDWLTFEFFILDCIVYLDIRFGEYRIQGRERFDTWSSGCQLASCILNLSANMAIFPAIRYISILLTIQVTTRKLFHFLIHVIHRGATVSIRWYRFESSFVLVTCKVILVSSLCKRRKILSGHWPRMKKHKLQLLRRYILVLYRLRNTNYTYLEDIS